MLRVVFGVLCWLVVAAVAIPVFLAFLFGVGVGRMWPRRDPRPDAQVVRLRNVAAGGRPKTPRPRSDPGPFAGHTGGVPEGDRPKGAA